jgi:hypothetical protein
MNMKPTLANIEVMAERLGATVEFSWSAVEAPVGKVWAATLSHSLGLENEVDWSDDRRTITAQLRRSYKSVLEDMTYQEEQGEWDDCDDPDCEFDGCPMYEVTR